MGWGTNIVSASPDGRFVYASSYYSGSEAIRVLNTNPLSTHSWIGIPVPGAYTYRRMYGIDQARYLYVSSSSWVVNDPGWDYGHLLRTDMATNILLETMSFRGVQFHDVKVATNDTYAAVIDNKNQKLHIVDFAGGNTLSSVAIAENPTDFVISVDNRYVYVAQRQSNTVLVIDLVAATVVDQIAITSPNNFALGPLGNRLYVTSRDTHSVFAVDLNANQVMGAIPVGNTPEPIALVAPVAVAPIAGAGSDQTVSESDAVTLDGSGSSDPHNDQLDYTWTQLAGSAVSLDTTDPARPTFRAPYVSDNVTLTFELVVDSGDEFSEPDTVDVTVVNVNTPPAADAGDDSTRKEGAAGQLDCSNSYDAEDDPVTCTWLQVEGPTVALIPSAMVANPTFIAPVAAGSVLRFQLQVSDGKEESTLSSLPDPDHQDDDIVAITIIENSPPESNAGSDQTKEEGSVVSLNGSGSSDPDGDGISYQWIQSSGPPVALSDDSAVSLTFDAPAVPPGGMELGFDLLVTDNDPTNSKSDSDEIVITIQNINDPPNCDLARAFCPRSKIKQNDSCNLWPPNHKLIDVSIEGVTDADLMYSDIRLVITGVTQDESVNGTGDGDSSPDGVIQVGDPIDSLLIRAERSGKGNGRVYTVTFNADDGFESCDGSVSIGVPHDRKDTPVDDGQTYDSTLP